MNNRLAEGKRILAANTRIQLSVEDVAEIIEEAKKTGFPQDIIINAISLAYTAGVATGARAEKRRAAKRAHATAATGE